MKILTAQEFQIENQKRLQKIKQNHKDFRNACKQFQDICKQIKIACNFEQFKGGFDEMVMFQQTDFYKTLEGLQLAIAWSAANELCVYEGKKLGYNQPDWWYKCWLYNFDEN